jgi:hypothetical protein
MAKFYTNQQLKRKFFTKKQVAAMSPDTRARLAVAKGTKTFEKRVLAVVNRKSETKYTSSIPSLAVAISSAVNTPAGFTGLLPPISQGTGESQRIGDRVQPTFARSTFTFYLSNTPNMFDVTLHLVIVMVKGAGSAAAVGAVPAGSLLKVGTGVNADPNDPNQTNMLSLVNHYPINTDQYTLCKWYKRRFAKGPGAINGAPAAAEAGQIANTASQQVIKYKWKPPTLKYDAAAASLPQNHYPVFVTWATANDGSALQGTVLNYSCRSEIYFKDA